MYEQLRQPPYSFPEPIPPAASVALLRVSSVVVVQLWQLDAVHARSRSLRSGGLPLGTRSVARNVAPPPSGSGPLTGGATARRAPRDVPPPVDNGPRCTTTAQALRGSSLSCVPQLR